MNLFSGYLQKKNKTWGGWKKKYFVLSPSQVLYYYRSKETTDEVVGSYDLTLSFIEELSIIDEEIDHYTKVKEGQLKNEGYKPTIKGEFKEKEGLYRISIISTSSTQKGLTHEARVTVLDCMNEENRKTFLIAYKKLKELNEISKGTDSKPTTPRGEKKEDPTPDEKRGRRLSVKLIGGMIKNLTTHTTEPELGHQTTKDNSYSKIKKLLSHQEIGNSKHNVVYSGFMMKKNKKWGGWKKKWFSLSSSLFLSYYRAKDEIDFIGSYDLLNSYVEEVSILDEEVENYCKVKEEQLKSNQYKSTRRGVFKEKEELFRIGIITTMSYQKGEKVENRVTVLDCITQENRNQFMAAYKQNLNEDRKKKEEELLERERKQDEQLVFKDVESYDKFKQIFNETEPSILIKLLESIDTNIFTESDMTSLLYIYDHSKFGSLTLLKASIIAELDQTLTAETLFRRNGVCSKLMTAYVKKYGLDFILGIIKDPILKIIEENKNLEIDTTKLQDMEKDSIEKFISENGKILSDIAEEIFQRIFKSKDSVPTPLIIFFSYLKEVSDAKFNGYGVTAVGAIFFLRLLCPGFVSPEAFGIVKEKPSSYPYRTLMILTKAFQNVANKQSESKKELFMKFLADFTERNIKPTFDFLDEISNPRDDLPEYKPKDEDLLPHFHQLHKLLKNIQRRHSFKSNSQNETYLQLQESLKPVVKTSIRSQNDNLWYIDQESNVHIRIFKVESNDIIKHIEESIINLMNYKKEQKDHRLIELYYKIQLLPCLNLILRVGFESCTSWDILTQIYSKEGSQEYKDMINKIDSIDYKCDNLKFIKFSLLNAQLLNELKLSNFYKEVLDLMDENKFSTQKRKDLSDKFQEYLNFLSDFKFNLSLEPKNHENIKEIQEILEINKKKIVQVEIEKWEDVEDLEDLEKSEENALEFRDSVGNKNDL